jgi:hypothetical protein
MRRATTPWLIAGLAMIPEVSIPYQYHPVLVSITGINTGSIGIDTKRALTAFLLCYTSLPSFLTFSLLV